MVEQLYFDRFSGRPDFANLFYTKVGVNYSQTIPLNEKKLALLDFQKDQI